MTITRRRFIFVGLVGIAAFGATRYWRRNAPDTRALRTLDTDAQPIVGAIAAVLLAGALPDESAGRKSALEETVAGVDRAIDGLTPSQRREIDQLFSLLAWAPARVALLRSTDDWTDATAERVDAFLAHLRDSRIAMLRAAYDALHQLVFAAWYGAPRAWPAIGYGGPPTIG